MGKDENRVPEVLAEDENGNAVPIKIDNATGRLLAKITDVTSVAPSDQSLGVRDENRIPVAMGEDSGGNPLPIMIDNRNGNVWADVNVE